ncbi:MAG TPA: transporter substrate-binding domain-containing protein [Pseudoduganella sp.]
MKVLAGLLCAQLAAPVQGQDLRLFLIPDTPAHVEAWQTIQAAAKRAGIAVSMQPLPSERGMIMTNRGELDGAIGRSMLAAGDYPDLVAVPEPVYLYAPSAYAYKPFDVKGGWQALRGRTLCMRRGYTLTEKRTRGMQRQRLENDASLLRMLRNGGCEIAVMDVHNKAMQAAMATDRDLLKLAPPLEEVPLYLFLHKQHAALVPRFAAALKQVKRE